MKENPKMRMFAGPNGAGKTSLVIEIEDKNYANIGVFLNADDIYQNFLYKPHLDLSHYNLQAITQKDLEIFADSCLKIEDRLQKPFEEFSLFINEGYLVKKEHNRKVSSYEAAFIIDFFREMLLKKGESFSFETVMSHSSKLNFITEAKKKNFKTYLYYVASDQPEIHVQRVRNRVKKGGHDVPEKKIIERYYRSMNNLLEAVQLADRAFIIDNSDQANNLVAEKSNEDTFEFYVDVVPWWVYQYIVDKLVD